MDEGRNDDCISDREQSLKIAVHYTVGKIIETVGEREKIHFGKEVIAAIAEIVWKTTETTARSLELFAKHAKRTTISTDDVLLCARANDDLANYLQSMIVDKKFMAKKKGSSLLDYMEKE